MGEPALKSDRANPERHPALRFWPRAEHVPDLGCVCLMEHLRTEHGIRNRRFRAFATYAYLQSQERGYTRFYQATAAKKFGVSICTIHRWTAALVELGLFATRKTDRELQLWPRWEALRLPAPAEEMQEQVQEQVQEHSFNRSDRVERQQSAHARESDAAACSSKETPEKPENEGLDPAPTRPARAPRPSPAPARREAGELNKKSGDRVSPHIAPPPGALVPSDVSPPVAVPERHLVRVAELHGTEIREQVERHIATDQRARAHPDATRAAVLRLATTPRDRVERNAMGLFVSFIRYAIAGTLGTVEEPRGQTWQSTLNRALEAAITGELEADTVEIRELMHHACLGEQQKLKEMRAPIEMENLRVACELAAPTFPKASTVLRPKLVAPRPPLAKLRDDLQGQLLLPPGLLSSTKRAAIEEQLRAIEAQIAGGAAA